MTVGSTRTRVGTPSCAFLMILELRAMRACPVYWEALAMLKWVRPRDQKIPGRIPVAKMKIVKYLRKLLLELEFEFELLELLGFVRMKLKIAREAAMRRGMRRTLQVLDREELKIPKEMRVEMV
jgi:hypothetical protein